MPKLTKRLVFLTVDEATYGVDPGSGYTAILTNVGAELRPNAEIIERNVLRSTFSPAGHVVGAKDWACRLPIEMKGGGISGTLQKPPTDGILKACGMLPTAGYIIAVDNVSGTFQVGEEIQNSTQASEVVGTLCDIVEAAGSLATLYIRVATNVPANDDALVGDTSSATADTVGTPDDSWVYRPETDRDNLISQTGHYCLDGICHIMTGVRGTLGLDLAVGGYGTFNAELTGVFNDPTDTPNPAATYSSITPAVCFSAGLQIGAWDMTTTATANYNIALNTEVRARQDINAAEGRVGFEITGRKPTGSLDPEVSALSDYNAWGIWKAATPQKLYAQIGSVAGNRVRVLVPQAVYGDMGYGDRDGILNYSLPFTAQGGAEGDGGTDGDDEVYLIFS